MLLWCSTKIWKTRKYNRARNRWIVEFSDRNRLNLHLALGVMKQEDEILKARNDKREYRRIVLQNNCDAETDKLRNLWLRVLVCILGFAEIWNWLGYFSILLFGLDFPSLFEMCCFDGCSCWFCSAFYLAVSRLIPFDAFLLPLFPLIHVISENQKKFAIWCLADESGTFIICYQVFIGFPNLIAGMHL